MSVVGPGASYLHYLVAAMEEVVVLKLVVSLAPLSCLISLDFEVVHLERHRR